MLRVMLMTIQGMLKVDRLERIGSPQAVENLSAISEWKHHRIHFSTTCVRRKTRVLNFTKSSFSQVPSAMPVLPIFRAHILGTLLRPRADPMDLRRQSLYRRWLGFSGTFPR
jgi:hypothetical protein